ncbi:MAG TPA: ADOP family duplicated permease [Gemmatimonadaceae bacterium]|nr:ADOP family duplicated permease [Gemmatimonadaceae bacterium]
MPTTQRSHPPPVPRLAFGLLRALVPPAERDELLADVADEYAHRRDAGGAAAARRWLWGQVVGSAPSLLAWSWWRGRTGWMPQANEMRPGGPMLNSLTADVRYAARRLRSHPVYALIAALTLALGVGGTAAVYGIARGLLFDPLPYAKEQEVAVFWMGYSWTEEEFLYLRGKIPGFREVASYRTYDATLQKTADAPTRLVPGIAASTELFGVLGARPMLGHDFKPGDDAVGAEPVVMLSYGLWKELGGDPSIVGKRVTMDGQPQTVVGVMPRGFWFPDPSVRVWFPATLRPDGRSGNYTFIGRLAPGQTIETMSGPIARFTTMLKERFTYPPQWDKTKDAKLTPVREYMLGSVRPALLATLAAMALILLIACSNVAALMLGQVEGRSTELAVRSALGANRRRLIQQLVVEALLLGVTAAVFGALLGGLGFRMLVHALPLGAWGESTTLGGSVFVAALVIAIGAALLVVLVPTVSLWRGDLRGAIGRARTGGVEGRGGRLEGGLVVAEVALGVLVAAGAALLVRSVNNLYAIDPGVRTEGVAVIDVNASNDMRSPRKRQNIDEMLRALSQLPGVKSVAATQRLPLRGGGDNWGIVIEGQPQSGSQADVSTTAFRIVSRDYFDALGVHVRSGRVFNGSDRAYDSTTMADTTTEGVVVVNQALAKKYFPGVDPIGRRIGGGLNRWDRIIGVVDDMAEDKLTDAPAPARYVLYDQVRYTPGSQSLAIRTTRPADAEHVLDAARTTVQRVAPDFAVNQVTTMSRVFADAVGPARQVMTLLALLAALALVLGAVGIYGVMSHFATRRKRDWAIQVALGLQPSRVVGQVVGRGAVLVGIGIAFGVVAAVALARLLASLLYGVSVVDPLALAAAASVLLAMGLLAAFVPAQRAGRLDPANALREQ